MLSSGRTEAMTSGPKVRLGTKRPSITSNWMRSTPAFSRAMHASPNWAKSTGSTDGAISMGRGASTDRPYRGHVRIGAVATTPAAPDRDVDPAERRRPGPSSSSTSSSWWPEVKGWPDRRASGSCSSAVRCRASGSGPRSSSATVGSSGPSSSTCVAALDRPGRTPVPGRRPRMRWLRPAARGAGGAAGDEGGDGGRRAAPPRPRGRARRWWSGRRCPPRGSARRCGPRSTTGGPASAVTTPTTWSRPTTASWPTRWSTS